MFKNRFRDSKKAQAVALALVIVWGSILIGTTIASKFTTRKMSDIRKDMGY